MHRHYDGYFFLMCIHRFNPSISKHSVLINLKNAKIGATAGHKQARNKTHLPARHFDTHDRQTSQLP